jgi:hypothetical protein
MYCGKEWNWHAAFRFVGSHEELLHGVCRLDPARIGKSSWDVCSRHQPVLEDENGWGVRKFQSGSLVEWGRKQYLNIKEFSARSKQRKSEFEKVSDENASLRRQLAAARKRSAGRLARLQKVAEPEAAKSPDLQPASPLRLVS